MKRIAFSLLLVLPAAALLATGAGETSGTTETAQTAELSWITWETALLTPELYDVLIGNFEAVHPGVTIARDVFPAGDREQYMKTLFAANMMPDLTFGGVYDLSKTPGALVALPDRITTLFDDAALTRIDGNVYYVPTVKQLAGNVFYNKDIFEEYGLTPPSDWDAFVEICSDLASRGVVPLMGGGTDKPFLTGFMLHNPMLTVWLHELDPDYASKFASGELRWNGSEMVEIVRAWDTLIDDGYFHPGSLSLTYEQYQQEFINGNAAMIVDGIWAATTYGENVDTFDVGYFLLPGPNSAEYYPVQYSDELAVAASSQHTDAALDFIEFFFTDEDTYRTYLETGGLYATKNPVVYPMPELMTEVVQTVSEGTPLLAFMRSPGQPAGFPQLFQKLGQDVFAGLDPQEAMDALETRYRELQEAQR